MGFAVRVFTTTEPSIRFESKKLRPWIQSPGIGGRARLWGGWMDFPTPEEFQREPWPVDHRRLRSCARSVHEWLEVKPAPFSRIFAEQGYVPKQEACKTWGRWPFAIRRHARVIRLLEEGDRITGFVFRDEKTGKRHSVEAERVILCASPFSTLSLLEGLPRRPPFLGKGISNHMVGGWIGVRPRSSPKLPPAHGYKKTREGVIELKGPFSARELDPDWGKYEYYRIHFIGKAGARRLEARDFRISGAWTWSASERARARRMDRLLKEELRGLDPALRCFRVQNPLDPTNIAHESGGAVLGKTVLPDGRVRNYSNLFVMDASVMPTGLATFPTLSLLALVESFLRRQQ